MTHSIACFEVFRELAGDRLKPAMAAGHSLGEYSALVATNALTFEDALKLVKKRGDKQFAGQQNHTTEEHGRNLLRLCENSDVIWSRDMGNNKEHREEDKK